MKYHFLFLGNADICTRTKDLSNDEKLVLDHIASARSEGMLIKFGQAYYLPLTVVCQVYGLKL